MSVSSVAKWLFIVGCLGSTGLLADSSLAERYDVDPQTGLRMERYRAPVPVDIPGGKTLDNVMAQQFHEQVDVIFIDVYPPKGLGHDPLDGSWVTNEVRKSIPGAVWLPEVGRGALTEEAFDYFQRNLTWLTEGDSSRSLVFFCTSDCWQSWNAGRRAIELGYTSVYWYPLGSDGWTETGLELAVIEPVNFFNEQPTQTGTAEEPASKKDANRLPTGGRIYLVRNDGQEQAIGSVRILPLDDASYEAHVEIDSDDFVDQFLSMRPFKCLVDPEEWFCYLGYPYELRNTITADDMTELSYQLLFIWKAPGEFGIDAWNGIYYDLTLNSEGSITGQLLEGDLSVLAEPPEPYSHPIDLGEFIGEGAKNRLYPSLIIRP